MKKRRTLFLWIIILSLTIGLTSILVFRAYHRERRSQELIAALKAGETQDALAALTAGADPNYRDNGDGPISFHSYLEALWKKLRGVRQPASTVRLSALGIAVEQDNTTVAEALLARGAVDVGDLLGDSRRFMSERSLSLLMAAAAHQNPALIRALVRHGWNVNAVSPDGQTALFYTSDAATINALAACGANVNLQDKYGATALDTALIDLDMEDSELDMAGGGIEALLAQGAYDPRAVPLAARYGRINALRQMIRQGRPFDTTDEHGVTPLMLALDYSTLAGLETVELLLQKGARADFRNSRGDSPLMRAAEGKCRGDRLEGEGEAEARSVAILKTLLDRGASVNAPREDGTTPLMLAAQHWRPDLAKLLLQHGAQVNARTHFGETALSLARSGPEDVNAPPSGRQAVIRLLQSAGAAD